MRGGINTFRALENRIPAHPDVQPRPGRIAEFLSRDDTPMNIKLNRVPAQMAGLSVRHLPKRSY
jgi:hypothetical protein